jgi:hypothetical protein
MARAVAQVVCFFCLAEAVASAGEGTPTEPPHDVAPSAARGLELLLNKTFLPSDFDQETFDAVWQVWPEPLRSRAEAASPDDRRQMAYRRYGLIERPGDGQHRPLQYVVDARGNWTMNCLACHQGTVAGKVVPGAPNTQFSLATLTTETRAVKLRHGKSLSHMDVGSLFVPLGETVGTTNAVMFGVVLMHYRDAELNVYPNRPPPTGLVNHDHDAPAWWHYRKKTMLYADGFAPKSHRALMPFLMVKQNGPDKFREWEDDFRHIEAYLESLRPPRYTGNIAHELAGQGELVFSRTCARCHGTYDEEPTWPGKVVPINAVGTDPVRLTGLSTSHRHNWGQSWFGFYGAPPRGRPVVEDPVGYVAPPLDGAWASAPYFHNGSVPTLWHVLHPDERPIVWRRTEGSDDAYDHERMGLVVAELDDIPHELSHPTDRRHYFDTRIEGKSAAGHDFAEVLDEDERRAVLEYLKTL